MADLNVEETKRLERNAKRRAKYAEKKNKPKKTKKSDVVNTTDIANILGALSHVMAARDGMAHWQLTPDEINKLAIPLTNILGNTGLLEELGAHGDSIALVTACFTIFAPRIAISVTNHKIKKEINNAGSNKVSNSTNQGGKIKKEQDRKADKRDNRDAARNVKDVSNEQLYLGAAFA